MSEVTSPDFMWGAGILPTLILGSSQGTTVADIGSQPAKSGGVPTVKTQIDNLNKLGGPAPGESKVTRGINVLEAIGYGSRGEDGFKYDAAFYEHRLETGSNLTEAQRTKAVEIVSNGRLRTGSEEQDLSAIRSALIKELGDGAGAQAGSFLTLSEAHAKFFGAFAKTHDSQKGFDEKGNAFLKQDGDTATLLPNGVINYIDRNGRAFVLVPGDTQARLIPKPVTTDQSIDLSGATSPGTAESPTMDGYRYVATVTAPLLQKGVHGSPSVKEGDVLQAKLMEKDGKYFIVTPEQIYALPADRINGSGEAADAVALRLAQDYLRYGYVTNGSKAESTSSLAISDVNKNTGQVVTAHLITLGDGSYTLGGESFQATSLSAAVERAILLVRTGSFLPDPAERVPDSPVTRTNVATFAPHTLQAALG